MSSGRGQFLYSKSLKLGPAIGDWTKIHVGTETLDEVQVSEVQNVNFDSLPREDMHQLHILHYRLAEKIARKISQDMNIKVELHTILATQLSYGEFVQSQDQRVVQANYVVKPYGDINVIFDWSLADVMVDRLIGGKGEESQRDEFSELDISILEAQVESLIPIVSKSWDDIFKPEDMSVNFSIGDYIVDKRNSAREAYVIFSFHLYYGKGELKKIIWAYPNRCIKRLLHQYRNLERDLKPTIKLADKTLNSISIPVKVSLGNATLTMNELQNLQVGDVISLDTKFSDLLEINIGEKCKLYGQPGVYDKQLAMQVVQSDEVENIVTVLPEIEGETFEHVGPKVVISNSKKIQSDDNPETISAESVSSDEIAEDVMPSVIPDDIESSTDEEPVRNNDPLIADSLLSVSEEERLESAADDIDESLASENNEDLNNEESVSSVENQDDIDFDEQDDVSHSEEFAVIDNDTEDISVPVDSIPEVDSGSEITSFDDESIASNEEITDDLGEDLDFDEDFSWDDLDEEEV